MKKSTYLYGRQFSAKTLANTPYVDALKTKIHLGETLLVALTEATTAKTEWTRISEVRKAIAFNEALLAEAQGKDEEV